jgi:hypothetical protein
MSDKKNQNSGNSEQVTSVNKLILIKNPVVCLTLIGIVGLAIRIYSYPYDLPVYQDVSDYFWYAIDMSILGEFPQMFSPYEEPSTTTVYPQYRFSNNGWPAFLSMFSKFANEKNKERNAGQPLLEKRYCGYTVVVEGSSYGENICGNSPSILISIAYQK